MAIFFLTGSLSSTTISEMNSLSRRLSRVYRDSDSRGCLPIQRPNQNRKRKIPAYLWTWLNPWSKGMTCFSKASLSATALKAGTNHESRLKKVYILYCYTGYCHHIVPGSDVKAFIPVADQYWLFEPQNLTRPHPFHVINVSLATFA